MNRLFAHFFLSLLSLCVSPNLVASELDSLTLPAQSTVSWVGRQLNQNGIWLDIFALRSHQPVNRMVQFFRELWADSDAGDRPGFTENVLGSWSVISSLINHQQVVVQITADGQGGSRGFISALDTRTLAGAQSVSEHTEPVWISGAGTTGMMSHDIPLPAGSRVLSRTATDDTFTQSVTQIATNRISVNRNAEYLKKRLSRHGWQLALSDNTPDIASLRFAKAEAYCEVAISRGNNNKTHLLITRVTYDE